ncbi:hypothetical protein ACC758_38240, partial [Rhizobium ruizarguesonis]
MAAGRISTGELYCPGSVFANGGLVTKRDIQQQFGQCKIVVRSVTWASERTTARMKTSVGVR